MKQNTSRQVWSHQTMQDVERAGVVTLLKSRDGEEISPSAVQPGQSVLMRSFSGNEYTAQRHNPLGNWEIDELKITYRVVRI